MRLRICVVMDLYTTEDTEVTSRFLGIALRRMIEEEGVQLAFAMFLPHCRQHRAVRRAGFVSLPAEHSPYKIAKVGKMAGEGQDVDEVELFRRRNWYVSFGDNDVF